MTARPALAVVPAEELPAVHVSLPDAAEPELVLMVRGRAGGTLARLDARSSRLLAASIRHVLDSRALGGLAVTIEVPDPGDSPCPPVRWAAGIMISAGPRGLVLALLDREAAPLTAGRLDDATIARLIGVPTT